ncbi:beta-ketoacyl-ACP synthase III [Nocardiopsis alba]|uniref:beta-ketoacyl-ACP synthase III n=1 Tax=Nocardiopsis alba TaxID=53437 RepID=UPI0033FFB811
MSAPPPGAREDHARLLGVGAYRPRRSVDNSEMCRRIDSTEEWILTRSGIRSRRFAEDDETLEYMAGEAAGKALAYAGIDGTEVDTVITASMTNLVQTPPLAAGVATLTGANGAAAFDLSAACAGFCHALEVGSALIRSGSARNTLVIGVERSTDIVAPDDRTVAFLFADGAGAVVLGPGPEPGIGPVVWGSDGEKGDALDMTRTWPEFVSDPAPGQPVIRMDGRRIFRWVVEGMVDVAHQALDKAGVTLDELSAFIPHQANARIIRMLAERLGLPERVAIADDITESGNTCAASVPLAMERLLAQGRAGRGELALLMGFGAGLGYSAQVVRLP